MTRGFCLALVAALLVGADAPPKDELEGTWVHLSAEELGLPPLAEEPSDADKGDKDKKDDKDKPRAKPDDGFQGFKMSFSKGQYLSMSDAKTIRGTYRVDASRDPKMIDLTRAPSGEVGLGIYRLVGDRLTLHVGARWRPTGFEPDPENRSFPLYFKRQPAPRRDLVPVAGLKGFWNRMTR